MSSANLGAPDQMYAAALIDQHPILRLGLARILSNITTIREVRTYDPEYLAAGAHRAESGLEVQILLFGLSGDAAKDMVLLEHMIEITSPKYVLLLSEDLHDPLISHPLISGRIRKSASSELIDAAVRLIMAGGRCFPSGGDPGAGGGAPGGGSPDVDMPGAVAPSQGAADNGEGAAFSAWPNPSVIAASARSLRITPRQFEILMLRARGFSHKAVGQMLNISEATVKAHASAMYRRLDVSTRQEAVKMAAERGIHFLLPPTNGDNKAG